MEKNAIQIVPVDGQYVARWSGPHAAEVRRLFGSVELPTPYTTATPGPDVKREIERLNPGVDITIIY
jgi:hypothetical protein